MLCRRAVLAVFVLMLAFTIQACSSRGPETARNGDVPSDWGNYKVGQPYKVGGVWYAPRVDYNYDETGIASWYGPGFDGKRTANGEVYDQDALTAAHKTLPMPSIVQVTNLENGRTIKVRINDRGPFVQGRIIDLSRRAAELLDVIKTGTARVRVQVSAQESQDIAQAMTGDTGLPPVRVAAAPRASVTKGGTLQPVDSAPLPPSPTAQKAPAPAESDRPAETVSRDISPPDENVTTVPITATQLFVQVGAYAVPENAKRVQQMLSARNIAQVYVSQVDVNGRILYRVRVGPFNQVAEADTALAKVSAAGYPDSRIIVN